MKFKTVLASAFICMLQAAGGSVIAQTSDLGPDQVGRAKFLEATKGKKVVMVPISTGTDLVESWLVLLRRQAEQLGYALEVRDPNWSTDTGIKAITGAMAEKPDLLIVQNPDIQSYAQLLKRAKAAGVKVLQINMPSLTPTEAYVGVDWVRMGEEKGRALVERCGKSAGPSNKIAFVQGVVTGAANIYVKRGLYSVLQSHPEIKIVSDQAGNYDREKIRGIMETVLQQHPDLCGAVGVWDSGDVGIGAAVEAAGKTGKVFVVTSGAGSVSSACENIKKGLFSTVISYNSPVQAILINQKIAELLQSPANAGDSGVVYYSPLTKISAETMTPVSCWSIDQL